jgi:hypothetical protein
MEYSRMTLVLSGDEMEFLCKAARRELRKPRDHARHLIRTALLSNADRLNANSDVNSRQGSHVAVAL